MIPDIVPVNNWPGNSSTTIFDFDFLINKESELQVLHTAANGTQTELKLNIDYTINQIGNEQGSYIVFPIQGSSYSVLKEDEKITLALNIPVAQTSPYGTSEKLNLHALEYSLDYIVRLIQMLRRKVERSVKVQEGANTTPDSLMQSLNNAQVNAQNSAQTAAQHAQNADNTLQYINGVKSLIDEAAQRAGEAANIVENCANKDLDNLSVFGQEKLNKAIAAGVYTKYAINNVPNDDYIMSGTINSGAYDAGIDVIEIEANGGKYFVELVGGGGGSHQVDGGKDQYSDTPRANHYCHAGGSGAYWRGLIQTSIGDILKIYIGASKAVFGGDGGDSYITIQKRGLAIEDPDTYETIGYEYGEETEIVRAGGGKSGGVPGATYGAAAEGGKVTYNELNKSCIAQILEAKDGNPGYITHWVHI